MSYFFEESLDTLIQSTKEVMLQETISFLDPVIPSTREMLQKQITYIDTLTKHAKRPLIELRRCHAFTTSKSNETTDQI